LIGEPQFRYNVASGAWSLHTATKDGKPFDYPERVDRDEATHLRPEVLPPSKGFDPFSLANAHITPPEKQFALDPGDSTKKLIRVFDNKFPIMNSSDSVSSANFSCGLRPCIAAVGVSEVVVQHWKYGMCTGLMKPEEIILLWRVIRDRAHILSQVPGVLWVQCSENHGMKSGGTLRHPHTHVLGLPFVPTDQARLHKLAEEFWRTEGHNLFDSMLCDALDPASRSRVLFEDEQCVAFVPWALERQFEFWVVPRAANALFSKASDEVVDAVAKALQYCMRLYLSLDDPDYNIMVRTGPLIVNSEPDTWYRWHICVAPSIDEWGGVKAFGGFLVAPILPEEMAERLRAMHNKSISADPLCRLSTQSSRSQRAMILPVVTFVSLASLAVGIVSYLR
jgi:UDPglucose--hexose-1-phosphate uridylyltransferase